MAIPMKQKKPTSELGYTSLQLAATLRVAAASERIASALEAIAAKYTEGFLPAGAAGPGPDDEDDIVPGLNPATPSPRPSPSHPPRSLSVSSSPAGPSSGGSSPIALADVLEIFAGKSGQDMENAGHNPSTAVELVECTTPARGTPVPAPKPVQSKADQAGFVDELIRAGAPFAPIPKAAKKRPRQRKLRRQQEKRVKAASSPWDRSDLFD